jgi:hypothetical protein
MSKERDRDFFNEADLNCVKVIKEKHVPMVDVYYSVTIIRNREGKRIYLYPQPTRAAAEAVVEEAEDWDTGGKYWTWIRHTTAQSDEQGVIHFRLEGDVDC